jgi:dihydrofolate reductase
MKVILLMAMTLDGKIGKSADHFPDWTGKEDKKLFVSITKRAGVMIMGSKTFDTIGAPLPNRRTVVMTRNPNRVSRWDNLIYTGDEPRAILGCLDGEGFSEVVLAGGATVNSLFAQEGLIDEIVVTVSPMIFGTGLSLFTESVSMDLELIEAERLGQNLVRLRYKVVE